MTDGARRSNHCAPRRVAGIRREALTLLTGFDASLDRLDEFEGDLPVPGFQRLEQLSIPLAQVAAAAFAHPVHRVVAQWWATARDGRRGVPRSSDFDPVDVSATLGGIGSGAR